MLLCIILYVSVVLSYADMWVHLWHAGTELELISVGSCGFHVAQGLVFLDQILYPRSQGTPLARVGKNGRKTQIFDE